MAYTLAKVKTFRGREGYGLNATTEVARRVAARCEDAYSFDRYMSWAGVAIALARHGLSEWEVEAVMRSKWTRWAADASDKSYGYATGADVVRWLEKTYPKPERLRLEVEHLTRGTFPEIARHVGPVSIRTSGSFVEIRQSNDDVVVEIATRGALHADLIAKALIDGGVSFKTKVE